MKILLFCLECRMPDHIKHPRSWAYVQTCPLCMLFHNVSLELCLWEVASCVDVVYLCVCVFCSDEACTSGQLVIASRESQYKILHFHHAGLDKLAEVFQQWKCCRETQLKDQVGALKTNYIVQGGRRVTELVGKHHMLCWDKCHCHPALGHCYSALCWSD